MEGRAEDIGEQTDADVSTESGSDTSSDTSEAEEQTGSDDETKADKKPARRRSVSRRRDRVASKRQTTESNVGVDADPTDVSGSDASAQANAGADTETVVDAIVPAREERNSDAQGSSFASSPVPDADVADAAEPDEPDKGGTLDKAEAPIKEETSDNA